VRDFRQLQVWQRSHAFTLAVYEASRSFSREEVYGLTSQLRRAAGSIPANIAGGCGRDTRRELARFLHIAQASASETAYYLMLAHDLGYLPDPHFANLSGEIDQVQRMLRTYTEKVAGD
jgi:four helix bundle protein